MVSCVQSLFMQMGTDGAINDPFQPRNGADSDCWLKFVLQVC